MKTKLACLFLMLCLTTLAIVTTPSIALASCSGDDCDCNVIAAACRAECPPFGQPGHQECFYDCNHEAIQCSVCCCCEDACPPYCYN